MAQPAVSHQPSGKLEKIRWTYYSTRRVPASSLANTSWDFFTYTVGQSIDSVTATIVDTNIKKPNAIEQPNTFDLLGMDFLIYPSGTSPIVSTANVIDDIQKLTLNSKFVFTISNKDRFQFSSLADFLAPSQILTAQYSRYSKPFRLKTKEVLFPEINFVPTVTFGSEATTPTNAMKMVLRLHGYLTRLADM